MRPAQYRSMLFSVPVSLGYPALAGLVLGDSAGLPLPGETALITAGGLAAAGHLALGLVVIIAVLAAVAGDTLGFWIGRRRGREVLLREYEVWVAMELFLTTPAGTDGPEGDRTDVRLVHGPWPLTLE